MKERPAPASGGWVVGPAFDLCFLANLPWLALFVPGVTTERDTAVEFWQLYFLTLPHRWITLVLVAADPDRRADRGAWLSSIALVAAIVTGGAYLGSGLFLCLGLVDYVWNAWHFGSQHAGVLRIYGRKVGGGWEWLERWGVRGFVVYVILRAAGPAIGVDFRSAMLGPVMPWIDGAIALIPVALVATNLIGWKWERIGKLAYVASVGGVYGAYLAGAHFDWPRWVLIGGTATSLFHAVEYLAIVSHYAERRKTVGSGGLFRWMAGRWVALLTVYVLVLGAIGSGLGTDDGLAALWFQGLNLWAAFVHYAYDGMIWKLRKPETARALGAEPGEGGAGG